MSFTKTSYETNTNVCSGGAKHPLSTEGVFLPEDYTSEVESQETNTKDKEYSGGSITSHEFLMSDGATYKVHYGNPHEPVTDIPTTITTPWMTTNEGLNKRRMLALMKFGFPIVSISAEQKYNDAPNLARSAHNQLKITQAITEQEKLEKNLLIAQGISRAAMIGFGLNAMSQDHDKKIIYSDLIVPCFPKPFKIMEGIDYTKTPLTEIATLRHLGRLPLHHLFRYPRTFTSNPSEILMNIRAIPTLTSGIAGDFADNMPTDTNATVVAFRKDKLSQGEEWQKILAKYEDVDLDLRAGGGHLGCSTPETYQAWHLRTSALQNEFKRTKNHPDKIGWRKIKQLS